jgi:hypothetical protein
MRLDHAVSLIIGQVLGRLLRRTVAMVVLGLFVLAAVYQFSVAGTLALDELYGPINARLIVAGIDLVIALIVFGILYATRARQAPPMSWGGIDGASRDVRVAMLMESILLGYTLARRRSRQA